MMKTPLSVIIPVYNEASGINSCISSLMESAGGRNIEIIVVDGHPEQSTLAAITHPILSINSPKGRAIQMNHGAEAASGDILLFLHADTTLPENGIEMLIDTLKDPKLAGGAFDLRIDAPGWIYRMIEWTASKRSRMTRIPYGDQAIFVRRGVFEAIGGYPEIPLMEDVELMRTLKQKALPIALIDSPASTSARRWKDRGAISATLRNWVLISLYLMGVSPKSLAKHY